MEIGTKILIKNTDQNKNDLALDALKGKEAVIVGKEFGSNYPYQIWILNEQVRREFSNDSILYAPSHYLKEVGHDDSAYHSFINISKQKDTLACVWGICQKCRNDYDMHYVKWCPVCDVPQKNENGHYDFLQLLKYALLNHKHFSTDQEALYLFFDPYEEFSSDGYELIALDESKTTNQEIRTMILFLKKKLNLDSSPFIVRVLY